MNTTIEELQAIYDDRKSFYKKAEVETAIKDGKTVKTLLSYGTRIAEVDEKGNIKLVSDNFQHYTDTTNRHLTEFSCQFANREIGTIDSIRKEFKANKWNYYDHRKKVEMVF